MAVRVTVCGTFIKPTGEPARGFVRFTMRPQTVKNIVDDTISINSVVANLDGSGSFEIDLQATDDPDIDPSGNWTYLVEEDVYDGPPRMYDIDLPIILIGPDCVNLADLSPTSPGGAGGGQGGVSLGTVLELLAELEAELLDIINDLKDDLGLNGPWVEP